MCLNFGYLFSANEDKLVKEVYKIIKIEHPFATIECKDDSDIIKFDIDTTLGKRTVELAFFKKDKGYRAVVIDVVVVHLIFH